MGYEEDLGLGDDETETKDKKNGEVQFKPGIDSQAGVDIYFKFHTVAQYVGLVRTNDVDFLRDEKDNILVNDDLQQDLLRICKIFNLTKDGSQGDKHCQYARPMYPKMKKNQIIKSIPYFFMQHQDFDEVQSQSGEEQYYDHRVFFFNEIQRRIIYGILRRVYALVAETFHEMLLMLPMQSTISIAMAQKYFGQLLHNQR